MAYKKIKPSDYTEEELRELWRTEYCRKIIRTHDGLRVRFYDNNFDHAFYESSKRGQSQNSKKKKDMLSYARLEKMLWIKEVLADREATMYAGYDARTKTYDYNRRVSVVKGDYVVIIWIKNESEANFITAYVADSSIGKILCSPLWTQKGR